MSYNVKVSKFSKLKPPLSNLIHQTVLYSCTLLSASGAEICKMMYRLLIKQTLQHTAHLPNSVFLYFPTVPFIFFFILLSLDLSCLILSISLKRK